MRSILIAVTAASLFGGMSYAQTAETTKTETFVSVQPTDVLSYNLIDLDVTNDAGEAIGEIKDLVIADGKLNGYVVSVGGFLGMGDHFVMVGPSAIKVTYMENEKKWMAVMNATKEELEKAPEFKYEGRWAR